MSIKGTWTAPEDIVVQEFNFFRGRVCSVIETVGLPAKQEDAFKTLVKQISYQQENIIKELIELLNERGAQFRYREGRLERE